MLRSIFIDKNDMPKSLYPQRLVFTGILHDKESNDDINININIEISKKETTIFNKIEDIQKKLYPMIVREIKIQTKLEKQIKENKQMINLANQIKEILDANNRRHSE